MMLAFLSIFSPLGNNVTHAISYTSGDPGNITITKRTDQIADDITINGYDVAV